jgi:hypothetical protein
VAHTPPGFLSIPIGADGKVAALNPRGSKLGDELAKLLGPPQEKEDEEDKSGEKEDSKE